MDGRRLTFDVLGLLEGVFRMRDRQTGSIWTHLDGKAIAGPLEGKRLEIFPIPQMTWGEWKADYSETLVLDPDTPFQDQRSGCSAARTTERICAAGRPHVPKCS